MLRGLAITGLADTKKDLKGAGYFSFKVFK